MPQSNANPTPAKPSVASVCRNYFVQFTETVEGNSIAKEKCKFCNKPYNFHKYSTQKLKDHLMNEHKDQTDVIEAIKAVTKQSDSTNLESLSQSEVEAKWALGWTSAGISRVAIDNRDLNDAIDASIATGFRPPNSHVLKKAQSNLAVSMSKQIINQLKCTGDAGSVTIMSDGWTNVVHNKVTNLCLQANETGFFWESFVNHSTKNTAEYLFNQMAPIIQQLISDGVHVFGFVADNESTNKSLFKLLHVRFPFLIEIPCSAHSIQLVVNDTLSKVPSMRQRVDEAIFLVRELTSSPTQCLKKHAQHNRVGQHAK